MEPATKRKVPMSIKSILDIDIEVTNNFVKFIDKKFGPLSKYNKLLKGLEISCHGIPWFFASASFIFLFDNSFIRHLSVNIFLALLFDIVIVAIVKAYTRRRRPIANKNDMFATYSVDKFSFPSGHATRAIMISVLLLLQYNLFFPLSTLLLAWSAVICFSRVLMRRHHILDVIGGAAIGTLDAIFISNFTWLSVESSHAIIDFLLDETRTGASFDV